MILHAPSVPHNNPVMLTDPESFMMEGKCKLVQFSNPNTLAVNYTPLQLIWVEGMGCAVLWLGEDEDSSASELPYTMWSFNAL